MKKGVFRTVNSELYENKSSYFSHIRPENAAKTIRKYLPELKVSAAIGVGGTLDVMAGTMKRAPLWMQKAKLEWAYRVILQPSRIGRLAALPRFVLAVKRAKRR